MHGFDLLGNLLLDTFFINNFLVLEVFNTIFILHEIVHLYI